MKTIVSILLALVSGVMWTYGNEAGVIAMIVYFLVVNLENNQL